VIAIILVLIVGAGWLGVLIAQGAHRLSAAEEGPRILGAVYLVPAALALALVTWLMVLRDGWWLAILVVAVAVVAGAAAFRMFRQ
jgi:hypothetical protein